MNDSLKQLITVLSELYALHQTLFDCARRLNSALKTKSPAAVQKLSSEYDVTLLSIQELEEKRLLLCDGLGDSLGLKGRHYSITALIGVVPEKDQGELSTLRDSLKLVLNELHKINCANKILLEEELLNIAKTMDLITKTDSKFVNYRHAGQKAPQPNTRTLFNKIA